MLRREIGDFDLQEVLGQKLILWILRFWVLLEIHPEDGKEENFFSRDKLFTALIS